MDSPKATAGVFDTLEVNLKLPKPIGKNSQSQNQEFNKYGNIQRCQFLKLRLTISR
jgi:hypothetical protein